ncbi:MAG TPA: M2 family metallopeptidase [Gaiellaceae bacterium]|nr:M2 family metallopeptidase [Gaiellaceae bacterium]
MSVSERALAELVERLQAELEPLSRQANEAYWQLNVTGEERWQEETARLSTELRTVLSRPEPYRLLQEAVADGDGLDPLLQRQALLLRNAHAPNQIPPETIERIVRMETALESRFNSFRGELDGERVGDNRIREILERSDDLDLRRRAWEASKQIGVEVAAQLRELVEERNRVARHLGWPTYYSMMLELDELDEGEVLGVLDRVVEGSQAAWDAYKGRLDERQAARFGIAVEELRPWHYADPFFQEAPAADVDLDRWFQGSSVEELVTAYFDAVGFDVRPILARSDLYERPGKCQHAFCMDIDRAGDIRVLANVRPTEYWVGTMLHELGHAVYDAGIDPSLPYFLRTHAHLIVTEGSAMLFGRLSRSGAWLARYAGMPEREAREADELLGAARRAQLLHLARWVPVMVRFERELYRDPRQDLNTVWWDLVERLQGVRRPDDRVAGGPHADWAAKIHLSVSPAYYQNYLLGEMTASQLQRALLALLGDGGDAWERYVASPEVARFLDARVFRAGRSVDWRTAVAAATGRPLDPAPFLAELGAV